MTVDAHVHLWNRATDPQDWIDPATMPAIDRDFGVADLVRMLDDSGADRAVVVQASNSAAETGRLLALDEPRIAGIVGWIDLTRDAAPQLDALAGAPARLVGIRHLVHVDADPRWLGRPEVGRGLEALAGAGLGFDLVLRAHQLELAAEIAAAHPATRFALDHLGGVADAGDGAAWEQGLRSLARHPNVVAKVSGLWGVGAEQVGRVVGIALEAFGPERLMYGSDWPLARMGAGAAAWRETAASAIGALSAAERDQILDGTAVRHYGLEAR